MPATSAQRAAAEPEFSLSHKLKKRFRNWCTRCLFRTLLAVLRTIPWNQAVAFGEGFGSFVYHLSRKYRRVGDKNLQIVYGDQMTPRERQQFIQRVFRNFARATLIEFLKVPYLKPEELNAIVHVDDLAPLKTALAKGKGAIVVSAHIGNWELIARQVAREGFPVLVVTRQSDDPKFNKITDELREGAGYGIHPRGSSPRALLKHLRSNGIVAILVDQKSDDLFFPFFGTIAGSTAGPAVLALKTGAAVVPLFYPRGSDGKYKAVFRPEIDTTSTSDNAGDILRVMMDISSECEKVIREYPDQWLWLHDRWRLPKDDQRLDVAATGKTRKTDGDRSMNEGIEPEEPISPATTTPDNTTPIVHAAGGNTDEYPGRIPPGTGSTYEDDEPAPANAEAA